MGNSRANLEKFQQHAGPINSGRMAIWESTNEHSAGFAVNAGEYFRQRKRVVTKMNDYYNSSDEVTDFSVVPQEHTEQLTQTSKQAIYTGTGYNPNLFKASKNNCVSKNYSRPEK